MADNTSTLSNFPIQGRQLLLVVLLVAVISGALIGGYFWLRPHYQVMFRDLKSQDAATIVAALEHDKIDYRLEDDGHTILVPDSQVHAVRLHLMTTDLPLKGTVGFELFNNSDLGLTEFAQKVDYQRALQGELARTIMSIDSVDSARVHLAIPESTLFHKNASKPKASVAITTHGSEVLPIESVRGIQRLVAAAVPDMEPSDVIIIDQTGAPVAHGSSSTGIADDPQLQMKMDLEAYYTHKLLEVIEPVVGKDKVMVSVDASINFDQVKVTQESNDSHASNTASRADASNSKSPSTAPLNVESESAALTEVPVIKSNGAASLPASDHEHSVRRLEQIVAAPGSIKRLTVGLLLRAPIDAATQARLVDLASATIGAVASRGDAVSVFAQNRLPLADPLLLSDQLSSSLPSKPATDAMTSAATPVPPAPSNTASVVVLILVGLLVTLVVVSTLLWIRFSRGRQLTPAQRAAYAKRIKQLLAEERLGDAHVA